MKKLNLQPKYKIKVLNYLSKYSTQIITSSANLYSHKQ